MVVEAMIAIFAPLVTDLNRSVFVVLIRAHLICENEMVEAIIRTNLKLTHGLEVSAQHFVIRNNAQEMSGRFKQKRVGI